MCLLAFIVLQQKSPTVTNYVLPKKSYIKQQMIIKQACLTDFFSPLKQQENSAGMPSKTQ